MQVAGGRRQAARVALLSAFCFLLSAFCFLLSAFCFLPCGFAAIPAERLCLSVGIIWFRGYASSKRDRGIASAFEISHPVRQSLTARNAASRQPRACASNQCLLCCLLPPAACLLPSAPCRLPPASCCLPSAFRRPVLPCYIRPPALSFPCYILSQACFRRSNLIPYRRIQDIHSHVYFVGRSL